MTTAQRIIKYLAIALALLIIVGIFVAALRMFGFFINSGVDNESKVYTVSEDITGLEMDINAADITLKEGEALSVESNLKYLNVEEKNGTLIVKETRKMASNYNGAMLTLYIPKGFAFDVAEITTGAGRLTVDTLSANKLYLELGAGEVRIDELNAISEAKIEGGAGALTISGGTLNNLKLDMGVGELDLTSAMLGSSELDYGVGKANLVLIGSKQDYRIEFDKGIGNATVEGDEMSDGSVCGDGENKIEIDGGIGSVKVTFKEE